jgi:hypothetical protein
MPPLFLIYGFCARPVVFVMYHDFILRNRTSEQCRSTQLRRDSTIHYPIHELGQVKIIQPHQNKS